MDTLFWVLGLCLTAAILAVFLQSSRLPILAVLVAVAAGVLVLLKLFPQLLEAVGLFQQLAAGFSQDSFYLTTMLKLIAITYVAEFGAQLCKDAGQNALALKVELAAKILILTLAVPIMAAILEAVVKLLP